MSVRNNHVVRVTVLGLAGITVDRSKCRDKVMSTVAPAQPTQMKSIVAFSRNSIIKGMTTQSKPLTRSPSDDIVVGQQGKIQDDETATNTTNTADRPQRHVAVWSSDTGILGSVVTFEANLQSVGDQRFAPMSFDLMIALTEDDDKEHKIALPFGVASLAISGGECKNGRPVQLDLPVLSLAAARPPANKAVGWKGGFSGYPMIAISPLPKEMPTKRTALQRLFQRQKKPKVPNEAVRQAFASAYSMDPNGDAILRVSLEVYERGSELEKAFFLGGDFLSRNSVVVSQKQLTPKEATNDDQIDQSTPKPSNDAPPVKDDSTHPVDDESIGTPNSQDYTFDDTFDDTFDGTYDGTFDDTYEGDTEGHSVGSGTYATNEDKLGFFAWDNAEGKEKDNDEDTYTLSFEKKVEATTAETEEPEGVSPIEIDFFGRKLQIPMCASLPMMKGNLDENDSVISRDTKGRLNQLMNDIRDDLTHVTADIFGRSYKIPVCSAVKGRDEYDDEYTLYTDRDTLNAAEKEGARYFSWIDKVCRRPKVYAGSPLDQSHPTRSEQQGKSDGDNVLESKDVMKPASAGSKGSNSQAEATKTIPPPPASAAKDWLVSSQMPGKNQQDASRGQTDSSPRGIHDFPSGSTRALARQPALPKKPAPLGKSFSEFFGFTHHQGERDPPAKSESLQADVPPVICPADDASVGDLTANTHEMNIASETKILERYQKKFQEQEIRERENAGSTRLMIPVPIAFGGDGICLGSTHVASTSGPTRVTSGGSNSMIESKTRTNENYFAEYDDYSIAAPSVAETKQGRDPPPTDDDVNDIAVASHPIEMTITGYHV